jgi:hypothetical protein
MSPPAMNTAPTSVVRSHLELRKDSEIPIGDMHGLEYRSEAK